MPDAKERTVAAVIFLTSFLVFLLARVHPVSDSRYAMLFSQQLLWNHSFSVEPRAIPELQPPGSGAPASEPATNNPYQVIRVGERVYHWYPPGVAILSMPFVALANAFGVSAIDQNGIHDQRAENHIQRVLAPLLMAGLSVIIFFTSRLIIPFGWSVLVAVAAAFGTQVLSTASRVVWSQTWGILILGFVIWLIIRSEVTKARLRPVLLATCLSCLYFVRPTFGVAIVAITIYVLFYQRRIFLAFVLTGCIWLGAFIGYSHYLFREPLPAYYHSFHWHLHLFRDGFPANLVSPSRGLFIFVPVLGFVIYLFMRYRPWCKPRLVVMAATVAFVHLVLISGAHGWHGGHCYGPRLSTDLVPWFALLGMLAIKTRLEWRERNPQRDSLFRRRTEWSVALVLLLCSVVLNGIGATRYDTWWWNALPTNIDKDLNRVWDWRHPQFLGLSRELRPTRANTVR